MSMNEPDEKPPHYRWPWVVLAAVVLFVVLTMIWMIFAVRQVKQERNLDVPLPAQSH